MSIPKGIHSKEKNIEELLLNKSYQLDFYQREYKWDTENIEDLLEDLSTKFLSFYEEGHTRKNVKTYGNYFLGPIVICQKENASFIVDGQQRLTTLTLLLIYIKNSEKSSINLKPYVFSDPFGEKAFNLDIPERNDCMNALLNNLDNFDISNQIERIKTIYSRYNDIKEKFPDDIQNSKLDLFTEWLLRKVELVEITAYNDEDAYAIFETMNDRGKSLNPTEMLKGYLLANMRIESRDGANGLWRNQIGELVKIDEKEEIDFFKAWLRAKYANTIRSRTKNAVPQDFENINSFHRWVRNEVSKLGLISKADFEDFVQNKFRFFSNNYITMLHHMKSYTKEFNYVYYNASNNFTLQLPLLLSPIVPEDNQYIIAKKMKLVSCYIDIFIARRVWNQKTLGYSSLVYTMFNLIQKIRDRTVQELGDILKKEITELSENFSTKPDFSLNQQNRRYVHRLLARISDYIEVGSKYPSIYLDYISSDLDRPFEIEHIWADKFSQHQDEFDNEYEFKEYRNRIGGLILIQRGPNQSFGDLEYSKKLPYYELQPSILARSLCKKQYEHETGFLSFIDKSKLPIKAHDEFNKRDLDEHGILYSIICEKIWNVNSFDQIIAQ